MRKSTLPIIEQSNTCDSHLQIKIKGLRNLRIEGFPPNKPADRDELTTRNQTGLQDKNVSMQKYYAYNV